MIVPGGQVLRDVLKPGVPTPLSRLVTRPPAPSPGLPPNPLRATPAVPAGPRPLTPPSPGRMLDPRALHLAPCLRTLTVIDASGCLRLDHLLGDDG